jgi:hypothetical protein
MPEELYKALTGRLKDTWGTLLKNVVDLRYLKNRNQFEVVPKPPKKML